MQNTNSISPYQSGSFEIAHAKVFRFACVFLFALSILILAFCDYNEVLRIGNSFEIPVWIGCLSAIFCVALALMVMGFAVKKIVVDGDTILYRAPLGGVETLAFGDVRKIVVRRNRKIDVYDEYGKAFSIGKNLQGRSCFLHCARKYNIEIEDKKKH